MSSVLALYRILIGNTIQKSNARLFLGYISADTGKHCIFGHLGLVCIWSCFVFCLLFLLFYVISAPVPTEATAFLGREDS